MADCVSVSASPPTGYTMSVVTDSSATGSISVVFSAAGTPTDPASGEVALIQFSLSNSTAI